MSDERMHSGVPQRASKIGIGVITCNRFGFFQACMSSVPEADCIVVVNDGKEYPPSSYPSRVARIVQHRKNQGVARSKNDALRVLLTMGCEHIFLCEDDIRILDPQLCERYIRASEISGILHFNFGYHGPRNKIQDGTPTMRKTVDYGGGMSVNLNYHVVGAFSYYRKIVLQRCGLMDPLYRNALDHVDHTYRIIQNGYHPPFWWFADIAESWRFIEDLDPELSHSTISSDTWKGRASFHASNLYFLWKNSHLVQNIPDVGEHLVTTALRNMQLKYGRSSTDVE